MGDFRTLDLFGNVPEEDPVEDEKACPQDSTEEPEEACSPENNGPAEEIHQETDAPAEKDEKPEKAGTPVCEEKSAEAAKAEEPDAEQHREEEPAAPEEPENAETAEVPEETAPAEEPLQAPAADARVDEVLAQLSGLAEAQKNMAERLDAMEALFQKKIMRSEYEKNMSDRQYDELKKYKEGLYAQLIRPILRDVITVRDSILRMADIFRARPEGQQDIPLESFANYSYDLQEILEKNEVLIYRGNPGDVFSPKRQHVVKKVKTTDESLHGKIAESLSSGYEYDGHILSAEKVSVYFYVKPENESNKESEE